MIRYVKAKLEITLFEGTWDEYIDAFIDKFKEDYSIEEADDNDYSLDTCTFTCSTDFTDDNEATGSTVAFCLMEDMLDLDFPVDEIVSLSDEIEDGY